MTAPPTDVKYIGISPLVGDALVISLVEIRRQVGWTKVKLRRFDVLPDELPGEQRRGGRPPKKPKERDPFDTRGVAEQRRTNNMVQIIAGWTGEGPGSKK